MKRRFMNFGLLLLAFPLLGGCAKELALGNEAGAPIIFGASTEYEVPGLTRTEYSGKDGSGWITTSSKGGYERIDWVGGTDEIRILCVAANSGQFDSGHSDDYTIGTPSEAGIKSTASIRPSNGNALKWGTGTHNFYAMYPAPGMVSNYAFPTADRTVSASNAVLEPTTTSGAATARLTGYIPAEQNVYYVAGSSQGTSFNEYKANMNYAYMYAGKSVNPSSSGSVSGSVTLTFYPLVTTFEFLLQQLSSDPITDKLTKVELSSTKATLTGKFQANLGVDGSGNGVLSSISKLTSPAPGNKVTITLPDGGMALSSTPLKINILTLPVDTQTELTLTLWFGATKKRELALKDNGAWISVPARGKIYFQNVGVPGTGWRYYNTSISNITLSGTEELVYGASKNVTVKSYRQEDKTSGAMYGIAWHAEAHEGTSSSTPFVRHDESGWPSWLTLSKYSGTGSASGESVTVNVAYNDFTGGTAKVIDAVTSGNGYNMVSTLRNASVVGSASSPRDLSQYSIYGNKYPDSKVPSITKAGHHTANCYVVSAPGHYCFPLVYGNSIDTSRGNENGTYYNSYRSQYKENSSLVYYHNADGKGITHRYIMSDTNLDQSGNYEAVVLWQDTPIGWRILNDSHPDALKIVKAPSSTNPGSTLTAYNYIQFYIDKNDILPGNIVIALRDTGKNKILWSWHIWVTATPNGGTTESGDDFTVRDWVSQLSSSDRVTYKLLHCPLGWTPPLSLSKRNTTARTATVRIVPDAGGAAPVTFTVSQPATPDALSPAYTGERYSNTYYQWGRKDPFLPSKGNSNTRKSSYTRRFPHNATTYAVEWTTADYARKAANRIKNPHIFDSEYDVNIQRYDAWNSNNKSNAYGTSVRDLVVHKTVYDPCPAGFSVPIGRVFRNDSRHGSNYHYNRTGAGYTTNYGRPRYYATAYNISTATANRTYNFYLTGYLNRGSGNLDEVGTGSNYWTAAPKSAKAAWNFDIDPNEADAPFDTDHANDDYAFPIIPALLGDI